MKSITMNVFQLILVFSALCVAALAQVTCQGALTAPNPITSDVNIPSGATCTLSVNVTGSVSVGNGASLTTTGIVLISGGLSASSAASINLGGTTTIQGGVMVTGANSVNIGPNVIAGSVAATDVTTLTHRGFATSIGVSGNGVTQILGGKVASGVSRGSGTGDLIACGAEITGGIAFVQATGSISVAASGTCAPSTIVGGILIEKGTGNVNIVGATTTGTDLQVVEVVGNVVVQSSSLSDISISGLDGSLTLSAAADSDTTIQGITGAITVTGFSTMGDFSLVSPGAGVTVTNSEFGNEAVNVLSAGGPVRFENVTDLNINAEGNPAVTVVGSSIGSAKFTGNTVLTLTNNTFSTILECVSNGAVNGGGNTIPAGAASSAGQCASIVTTV